MDYLIFFLRNNTVIRLGVFCEILTLLLIHRADQSHRIPSYQPDQLIENHLHKKQCRMRYNAPSSIRIHILFSVCLLHYTCTIKYAM